MLRYRYKNTSPKRQDWEGAHTWVKGGKSTRPLRLRHYPVVAWAKWHDPEGHSSLGFELYTADRSSAFLKGTFGAMVEADKEAVGPWKAKPSVTLPGEKYLAALRRRFTAMVGPDDEWYAYRDRQKKQLARQGPRARKS